MKKNVEIRVCVGERPGKGYGARTLCEEAMKRLSNVFNAGVLLRYGLSRNASTFSDLIRGGSFSVRSYRVELEKQLPISSTVQFIADRAKASVSEAVGELEAYIRTLQKAMRVPNNCHLYLQPEYIQFDEESEKVVWSAEGVKAIEDVEGYYLTNEKQVQVYELAKEIVGKIEDLNKILTGPRHNAVSDSTGNGILVLEAGGSVSIRIESLVGIEA